MTWHPGCWQESRAGGGLALLSNEGFFKYGDCYFELSSQKGFLQYYAPSSINPAGFTYGSDACIYKITDVPANLLAVAKSVEG